MIKDLIASWNISEAIFWILVAQGAFLFVVLVVLLALLVRTVCVKRRAREEKLRRRAFVMREASRPTFPEGPHTIGCRSREYNAYVRRYVDEVMDHALEASYASSGKGTGPFPAPPKFDPPKEK